MVDTDRTRIFTRYLVGLPPLIALAAAVVVVVLVATAARLPLVRRLGLRNAIRRPREAALVMLGCVLGTALIVGSGTVGSSFTASLRDRALQHTGSVDARVTYETRDEWAAATARLAATRSGLVRFATPVATIGVPLSAPDGSAAPRARLIEADYRRAGPLNEVAGIRAGTGPAVGETWVARALARHLKVRVGDHITVHTRPETLLRVAKIVDTPLVTFEEEFRDTGDNFLVGPGTVSGLQAKDQSLVPQWSTLVVGRGPHSGTTPTRDGQQLQEFLTRTLGGFNAHVAMVRSDRLEIAERTGEASGVFLTTIGAFGILAGILLLVNVLLMLAEERLSELGTLRAVGMARVPLVGSFSLEGAVYAAVGALIGGAVGIGLGQFMVRITTGLAKSTDALQSGLDVRFALDKVAVANGVATGFLVSVAAVVATAYRVSRRDVIRSIRELPDARRSRRRAATPLLLLGIAAGPPISWIGYSSNLTLEFLLGLPLAFACLGLLASRRVGVDRTLSLVCGANIVWAVFCQIASNDPNPPPSTVVAVGIVLVISGTLFANAQQASLGHALRRVGRGRSVVTTRLGLANPIAHRVRMLLTVGPLALVVFTLVYAEGLAHMITTELDRIGPRSLGSYGVFATSSTANPFDFAGYASPEIETISRTSTILAVFGTGNASARTAWPLTAVSGDLASVTPPPLISRDGAFSSDAAVFRAVARNPELVIVPANFLVTGPRHPGDTGQGTTAVGDVVRIDDPVSGTAREARVVGVSFTDVVGHGVFYGDAGARTLFGGRLRPNSAFIAPTRDPDALVEDLQRAGVANGLEAIEIGAASERYFAFVDDSVVLYRTDLGIGIVVGVVGIGVVLVRSVRDRRRQIGMLRAMGFDAKQIGRSFLLEGAFTAGQGVLVGVGLGVVITMALTQSANAKNLFGYHPDVSPPNLAVALLAAALFVASLIASVAPARAASRIPPAVALRLVD